MRFLKIKLPAGLSIIILCGLILLSLQLMSSATQESSQLNAMYSWLLWINGAGTIALLGLVGVNLFSLTRQLKRREAGSRLTIRMVTLFVVLALSPAGIVFYFSMQFLHQGIDSWFNVEMDRAMEDALELSQASLDQRIRWNLTQTQQLVEKIIELPESQVSLELENFRVLSNAAEMTLFSRQNRIIASSSTNPSDILPSLPDEHTWLQLRQNGEYAALATVRKEELMIRVILTLKGKDPRYLQALYP
ncbi:MAG TPA: PAS domain-containing sensor histidine kinase, partial [Methylococcaceae bacterium]|nr:PAS domain-containing sensor histidine kinase [Methylococcaceae bacterium]